MSLTSLLVRDVLISSAITRVDDYGDTQLDWSSATVRSVKGWLAQSSSGEYRDGRDGTATVMALVVPAGTIVTAHDRVMIDGVTYEVIADAVAAWTPRGEHHRELSLGLVRG